MAKLTGKAIQQRAREIIQGTPGGLRYASLVNQIASEHPETPKNTIHGAVWDLDRTFAGMIAKPSRGLFVSVGEDQSTTSGIKGERAPKVREAHFFFTRALPSG